ncbi:MAG TPA: fibronectin type III domain-containing protein, partial [Candidatus Kapabacteria bacterium]|nr:fibronectin type III domain-containing protein [Candidatus Kapabacteria bacterium]
MKIARQLTIGAIAFCTACAVFFIVSCSSNSNPTSTGGQMYAPPTALRALSGDDTLYVVWTASTAKDSSAFAGYYITALDPVSGSSVTITDPNKNDTTIAIGGLTNGKVYTITIRSLATDGTQGPVSASLKWAPAKRYYNIQLYSLAASSSCPSGLQLSATNGVGPISVTGNLNIVDLVYDDRGNSFDLVSPTLKSGTPGTRITNIAGYTGAATGLSDIVLADSLVDTTGWVPEVAPLGAGGNGLATNGKGVTYYVATQDGNFARIFVHPTASGSLWTLDNSGGACNGYTYITVD